MYKMTNRTLLVYALTMLLLTVGGFSLIRYFLVSSEAYNVATACVLEDKDTQRTTGDISGVGLAWFATSSVDSSAINGQRSGQAIIWPVVDGVERSEKYDVQLELSSGGK